MNSLLSGINAQVQVLRRSQSVDAEGAPVQSWFVYRDRVLCYFEQASQVESVQGGADRQTRTGEAHFWPGIEIRADDRLQLGTRRFRVVGVDEVRMSPEIIDYIKVAWEEVTGAD